jgi:hypothetical protein
LLGPSLADADGFLSQGAVVLTADDLPAADKITLDGVFAAAVTPADGLPISRFSTNPFARAGLSPFEVATMSRTSMGLGTGDVLPGRSYAGRADSDAHQVTLLCSKPGRAGDGILPTGPMDRLFGSNRQDRLLVDESPSFPQCAGKPEAWFGSSFLPKNGAGLG